MEAPLISSNALARIQTEYLEMPGLKLTLEQVGRLCGLTHDMSEAALAGFTRSGFLRRAQDGTFLRPSQAPYTTVPSAIRPNFGTMMMPLRM